MSFEYIVRLYYTLHLEGDNKRYRALEEGLIRIEIICTSYAVIPVQLWRIFFEVDQLNLLIIFIAIGIIVLISQSIYLRNKYLNVEMLKNLKPVRSKRARCYGAMLELLSLINYAIAVWPFWIGKIGDSIENISK